MKRTLLLVLLIAWVPTTYSASLAAGALPQDVDEFGPLDGGPIHVKADAIGRNNGRAWRHAYRSLSRALAAAEPGDEIWVAAGTYRPEQSFDPVTGQASVDPRAATFLVRAGVSVYGGFLGVERARVQRAGLYGQTILTGDLGSAGESSDNAYHVMTYDADRGLGKPRSTIDGFTVQHGRADGLFTNGGGLLVLDTDTAFVERAKLSLRNMTFRDNFALNRGGGLYALALQGTIFRSVFVRNTAGHGGGAALEFYIGDQKGIVSSMFLDNTAFSRGGALFRRGGTVASGNQISNSIFYGNSAGTTGGAIFNKPAGTESSDNPWVISNSLFAFNEATRGGAFWIDSGRDLGALTVPAPGVRLINVTCAKNSASAEGAVAYLNPGRLRADVQLQGCIVWGNGPTPFVGPFSANESDIEGGGPGNNIDVDPRFVDALFRISGSSPARRGASAAALPADIFDVDGDGDFTEPNRLDLSGLPRTADRIDMGASEVQTERIRHP